MTDKAPPKRKRGLKGTVTNMGRPKGSPMTAKQAETAFGGVRGNPSGISREQALARYEAGKLAEQAQVIWLRELVDKMSKVEGGALDELRRDTLALVTDAIDRANGKAVATVDHKSSDGSAAPSTIRIVAVRPDDRSDD